ncbi:MAG TPA: hypothetical protein VJ183_03475 [Chloroflexia bacterium]|nr:hypothetical protein [Chloroflexia bacterium]
MARVKKNSRRLFLGAAFIGVMAGSGALFGAIGGLMLVLLSHAVFRLDAITLPLMIACGSVGVVAATLWSLFLVTRPVAGTLAWQKVSSSHPKLDAS